MGAPRVVSADPAHQEQGYVVRRWGVEEGLPEATITTVSTLSDGFLWLTTPRHVVRFDGVEFVAVRSEDYPEPKPKRFNSLVRDGFGNMWVSGEDGVMRHDGRRWLSVPFDKRPQRIFWVREGADGVLWAASTRGMYRYDGQGFDWVRGGARETGEGFVSAVAASTTAGGGEDARARAWLLDAKDVVAFDGQSYARVALADAGDGRPPLARLFAGSGESLWASDVEQDLYHLASGRWEGLPPPTLRVSSLLETADGDAWVGAVEGLYRMSGGRWSFVPGVGLEMGETVSCLAPEAAGRGLWAGTGNGLVQLLPRKIEMVSDRGAGRGRAVTALRPQGTNGLWVGMANRGLWAWSDGRLTEAMKTPASVMQSLYVTVLEASRDGSLWFGTRGNHVWRLLADGTVRQVQSADALAFRDVLSLLEDRAGCRWAGTRRGIFKLDGTLFAPVEGGPDDLVVALCEDEQDGFWAGTQSSGLWHRSGAGGWSVVGKPEGLPSEVIRALCRGPDGSVWVATPKGVARVAGRTGRDGDPAVAEHARHGRTSAPSGQVVRFFAREHGLPSDDIRQVLDDGQGSLWLGARDCIMRVRHMEFEELLAGKRELLTPYVFGSGDGLAGSLTRGEHGGPLAVRMDDGRLCFATSAGVAVLHAAETEVTKVSSLRVCPVGITASRGTYEPRRIGGVYRLLGTDQAFPPVAVAAGSRDIVIHFTSPCFSAPEQVLFRTWLEGYDSGWGKPSSERERTYPRLQPGNYRFRVMASSPSGEWRESEQKLRLFMRPFFWQTWWFWLAIGGSALALTGLATGWVVRRRAFTKMEAVRRRQEYERALERERSRIARDIHDDLGASLTQIALLSELAAADCHEPEVARAHVGNIFQTARAVTRALDEIVWAVNPKNDTLENFAAYLSQYVQDYLRSASLSCRLFFPDELPAYEMTSALRHNVFLVVKEALKNVVCHAGASEVSVALAVEAGRCVIRIRDNGCGFDPEAGFQARPGGGNGLANMRKRMADVEGTLDVRTHPDKGVEVTLVVPLAVALSAELPT